MEQCKDEETKSEEVTSEEFNGRFGVFTRKELKLRVSTQADQVSIPNNFEVKFKEVDEIRMMLDPDKLVSPVQLGEGGQ